MTTTVTTQGATLAEWLVAVGTIFLGVATFAAIVVAIFQDRIRAWFYRPRLEISIANHPPECLSIPLHSYPAGTFAADCIYLRLRVTNVGNAAAREVEVFATELKKLDPNGNWLTVHPFLPMNLKFADVGQPYFPIVSPTMYKFCDLARVVDPTKRHLVNDDNPDLHLRPTTTSLKFETLVEPTNRGHVIPPGTYRLALIAAAVDTPPTTCVVEIMLSGSWYVQERRMLESGVTARILPE